MKKFLKRFALISLIALVVVLILSAIAVSVFEGPIGRKVLAEVNERLTSELSVEELDLTFLSTFPNVSANLREVALADNQGGILLEAENVSFRFGLLSLLSRKIQLRSVVVARGALNVQIDQKGQPNYAIFREGEATDSTATGGSGGTVISLASAQLQDIELIYGDASLEQEMRLELLQAGFTGEFSSSRFDLQSQADLVSGFVDIGSQRFLPGRRVSYDATILVDLEEGRYELQDVQLQVEDNRFAVNGRVESWEEGPYYDLFVSSDQGSLAAVLAWLPSGYLDRFGDFNSSGNFSFKAGLKGLDSATEKPELRVEVGLADGRITSPRMKESLRDVSFTAIYDNGGSGSNSAAFFALRDFKGYFNRELLEMNLRVNDLDDPLIDFQMDGVAPMESLYGLLDNPKITDGRGEIEVRNLRVQGRYADMRNTSRISRVAASGELEFDDASLTVNEERIILDRGRLQLDGNALTLDGLKMEGAGSEFVFNGSAFNLIPVLFADSLNSEQAELEFQAALEADQLDLDRLMHVLAVAETIVSSAAEETVDSLRSLQIQKRESATRFLRGAFDVHVRQFNYDLIEGKEFTGKLEFDNNEMHIRGATQAMGGAFELDGRVFFQSAPHLEATLTGGGIDVHEFFRQARDFGQEVLQSRHLSGTLNTQIAIDAFWDSQGNFLDEHLHVLAGLSIEEGELKDFELLKNFSSFVKIKDLQRVRFAKLENYLEVRNRRIFLPVMFIQSNAINLTVNGEHSFDQEVYYNVKVNAGQTLMGKIKSYNPALRPKKARRNGWFNLYYTINGTLADYEMKAAKKQVKSDFERSELRRRDIQLALTRYFGRAQMIEEPPEWQEEPGQEEDVEYMWEN